MENRDWKVCVHLFFFFLFSKARYSIVLEQGFYVILILTPLFCIDKRDSHRTNLKIAHVWCICVPG